MFHKFLDMTSSKYVYIRKNNLFEDTEKFMQMIFAIFFVCYVEGVLRKNIGRMMFFSL